MIITIHDDTSLCMHIFLCASFNWVPCMCMHVARKIDLHTFPREFEREKGFIGFGGTRTSNPWVGSHVPTNQTLCYSDVIFFVIITNLYRNQQRSFLMIFSPQGITESYMPSKHSPRTRRPRYSILCPRKL